MNSIWGIVFRLFFFFPFGQADYVARTGLKLGSPSQTDLKLKNPVCLPLL